uniref:Macaca fascicularis brain cDNA clone: QmoA-11639, similar to human hypothetical protein FLJ20244 (FLJ20244), mRNA, RefSeq: NM_017722.2 n=1 Tax=Macaca fascicularis TaxID=9541 RepID=I7GJ50_MACFA|nr:unnamed protein product [Macaca fascicularis]
MSHARIVSVAKPHSPPHPCALYSPVFRGAVPRAAESSSDGERHRALQRRMPT